MRGPGLAGGVPTTRAAGRTLGEDLVVLDVDATIVVAHGEKENAAAKGERKLEVMRRYLNAKAKTGRAGVSAIGYAPRAGIGVSAPHHSHVTTPPGAGDATLSSRLGLGLGFWLWAASSRGRWEAGLPFSS